MPVVGRSFAGSTHKTSFLLMLSCVFVANFISIMSRIKSVVGIGVFSSLPVATQNMSNCIVQPLPFLCFEVLCGHFDESHVTV